MFGLAGLAGLAGLGVVAILALGKVIDVVFFGGGKPKQIEGTQGVGSPSSRDVMIPSNTGNTDGGQ